MKILAILITVTHTGGNMIDGNDEPSYNNANNMGKF
jgi:hypothetical protein